MNDIVTTTKFNFILILDGIDYEDINVQLGLLNRSVKCTLSAQYSIGEKKWYHSMEFNCLGTGYKKEALISYLAHHFNYIAMRVEDSPCVMVPNEGDFLDYYLDEYEDSLKATGFCKDLLTIKERMYLLLKEINVGNAEININLWTEGKGYVGYPLRLNPQLAFQDSTDYDISVQGEESICIVDIIMRIPVQKFKIIIAQNLHKSYKKIL